MLVLLNVDALMGADAAKLFIGPPKDMAEDDSPKRQRLSKPA